MGAKRFKSLVLYMVNGEISIYPHLIFFYFLINFAWYAIIIAAETEDRGNKSKTNQSTNLPINQSFKILVTHTISLYA